MARLQVVERCTAGDRDSPRAFAALSAGILSLLASGLMPLLLGALCDQHRLTTQGIGQLGAVETFAMAAATALASLLFQPKKLKSIGIAASLVLAITNGLTMGACGQHLFVVRAFAGIPEGVLLWIAIGFVARSDAPERQAGVLFAAMAALQLLTALIITALVIPHFGADGAYGVLALVSLLGVITSIFLPRRYAALSAGADSEKPSPKGLIALFSTFLFQALIGAVSIYILPLATEAGVSPLGGEIAVAVALAAQVLGGLLAIALSGRVSHFKVFATGGIALFCALLALSSRTPSWLFISACGAIGLLAVSILPFFVPMTVNADPSRRSAVHLGGAQLFGSAIGPLAASFFIDGRDASGVVVLADILLALSLAIALLLSRPRSMLRRSDIARSKILATQVAASA